jgi:hypothetical protein
MRTPLFHCALVLLLLPMGLSAANVLLREPGYLVIDGSYHVFDLPRHGNGRVPVELHAQGVDGFYMRSLLAAGSCQTGGDPGAPPRPGLRFGEALNAPDAIRLDLRAAPGQLASMTLATCDGAVVVFANTASGTTTCNGTVGFPFRRGKCPAIDRNDPGLVFFDTFGQR